MKKWVSIIISVVVLISGLVSPGRGAVAAGASVGGAHLFWHGFYGPVVGATYGQNVQRDAQGNIYVAGTSASTWGSPVSPYTGGKDGFVAKLSSSHTLLWLTFFGGSSDETVAGLAVGMNGAVYVAGTSNLSWGVNPVRPFSGSQNGFVLCLDGATGQRSWLTFLGASTDEITGITTDSSGLLLVSGDSGATWGTPVSPFVPFNSFHNLFAAHLKSTGALDWNTFFGIEYVMFYGGDIKAESSGTIYVGGTANNPGEYPVPGYKGAEDAVVEKLNASGQQVWVTFLGSDKNDTLTRLALDGQGSIFISGSSSATWGSPVAPFPGSADCYVAKLKTDGTVQWNTFIGTVNTNGIAFCQGLALDSTGNVLIDGTSWTSWGSPLIPFHGTNSDIFIAKLDASGVRQWNLFLGSTYNDLGGQIITSGGVFTVVGSSAAIWGISASPYPVSEAVAMVATFYPYQTFLPVVNH